MSSVTKRSNDMIEQDTNQSAQEEMAPRSTTDDLDGNKEDGKRTLIRNR